MNPVFKALAQRAAQLQEERDKQINERKAQVEAHVTKGAQTPERAAAWQFNGRYFGYPQCCVSQFIMDCCVETRKQFPNDPWVGTGFFPCLDHAKMIPDKAALREFVRSTINPSRNPEADDFGPGARGMR